VLIIANELRDTAECAREFAFYEKYLGIFIPMLVTILGDEKGISFAKDSPDYVSSYMAWLTTAISPYPLGFPPSATPLGAISSTRSDSDGVDDQAPAG
jgi:hypothetical protein